MKTFMLSVVMAMTACTASTPPQVVEKSEDVRTTSFAEVIMTLDGCTSCAPCRTTIRQVVQASSHADQVSFGDQMKSAKMVYTSPRELPVHQVYERILSSGLSDVSVAGMTLEAAGMIETGGTGGPQFVLGGTNQRFPIETLPKDFHAGSNLVRVKAEFHGLGAGKALSLVIREIQINR